MTLYKPRGWADSWYMDANGIPFVLADESFTEQAPIKVLIDWEPRVFKREEVNVNETTDREE